MKYSVFQVSVFLALVISCAGNSYTAYGSRLQGKGKTWCVATVSAPNNKLQAFIDYACGRYDCKGIKPGGSCYTPNTLQNHASYALDLVYRNTGVCNFEIGTTAITDPSFGPCRYP